MLIIELQRRALRSPDVRLLASISLLLVVLGAAFFHVQEGFGWLDAFYFTIITLTTVGYGDMSPSTPAGKLFTIFYVLIGLGIIATLIGTVANLVSEIAREKRS
jgi:voltage-gated potassium channel